MSSLEITLNEFVTKIPLCQANVSWDKLMAALDSSSSGIIAIVDPNYLPLGILESHKLLAEIANNSRASGIIPEETLKSLPKPVGLTHNVKLKSLISQITVLSSQTKLQDFISLLNSQESLISEKNYLIVDSTKKVLGILNLPKLLKHIAKDYTGHQLDRQSFPHHLEEIYLAESQTLFSLWEQIPCPLVLHDTEGNICYQNPAWLQHLNQDQEVPWTDFKEQSNFITAPELAWQSAMFSQIPEPRPSAIFSQCYCPIKQDGIPSFAIGSQPQSLISTSSETFFLRDNYQNAIVDIDEQITNNNFLTAQNTIEKTNNKLDWHYIKFPIQLTAKTLEEAPHNQSSQKYWLVLATQLDRGTPVTAGTVASWCAFPRSGNPTGVTPLLRRCNGDSSHYIETHKAQVTDTNNNGEQVRESYSNSEPDQLRRLQNEFLINIAHDLKSPLTAIIGLSSLLREEKLGSLNPRQIRYLDLIYRGGRQLMGTVTELLEITSLATGTLRLKLETIELEQFCHQAYQQVVTKLKAVQDTHSNKPLILPQCQLNLESGSSVVIADRLRLNQILTRLLENAVKSTPAEAEIGIKVERWTEWVAIIVWDRGRGLSETVQKSLLEEMFEPDNFLSSLERSNGLGLMLAQQLARSHGGDISFTSQINRGSEFTLLLPANPFHNISEQDGGTSTEAVLASDHNQHTHQSSLVLIVETSSLRIQDLTESLQELGYHAAIARNQNEALYKARHLKPSKIILNHELVELAGQDILAELKSAPQTSQIPVILLCENHLLPKYQYSLLEKILLLPLNKINPEMLSKYFPPLRSQSYSPEKILTILRLGLNQEAKNLTGSEIDSLFGNYSFNICHHIIEADSLEQANILVKIWNIDLIIWDSSNLESPLELLRSLVTFPHLAQIPMITLDEKTTAAANQFEDLTVFPCLVPINEQNITELMEVIQNAATAIDNES